MRALLLGGDRGRVIQQLKQGDQNGKRKRIGKGDSRHKYSQILPHYPSDLDA